MMLRLVLLAALVPAVALGQGTGTEGGGATGTEIAAPASPAAEAAPAAEAGPSGRLAAWAKLQREADMGRAADPASPDIEMTSVTGPEVNLDSATGGTGATGSAGGSSTGGATGPVASGTGGEGMEISPELRAKCVEFGQKMLALFTKNSTESDSSKYIGSAERIMRCVAQPTTRA